MDRLLFIYLPALLLFLTMRTDIPENGFPETVLSDAIHPSVTSGSESGFHPDHRLMAATSTSSDDMITETLFSKSHYGSLRSVRFQKSITELRAETLSRHPVSDNIHTYRQSYNRCRALRHDQGIYLRLLHTLII